jgi:polar amino acid transport system substrate-binding protein
MEENPDASESDADDPDPDPSPEPSEATRCRVRLASLPRSDHLRSRPISSLAGTVLLGLSLVVLSGTLATAQAPADALERVKKSGRLLYGSDMEGGGPYAYLDARSSSGVTGFEVELMALLARDIGAEAVFSQGPWDKLLQVLDSGRIDLVINGYESTPRRDRDYLATRPYYVYQFQLMVHRGSTVRSWADLKKPRPGGGHWTVAVLVGSAAEAFVNERGGPDVQAVPFDGSTDAMLAVQNGQYDMTLQDLPAARFYAGRFAGLEAVGPPESHGFYVIYVRDRDATLRDALDQGLARLIASGELRRLYERYGIWTEAQDELSTFTGPIPRVTGERGPVGWALLIEYRWRLIKAAYVTFALSVSSMPLAIILGLLIAIGRLYGPAPLRPILSGYVELLRGTPLMLQLYVLFFLLKLNPWIAGIAGLAINYSAYEAEIYRAGLQAIPAGQMEAAVALGMSRWMALRRVIIPQAVRIVIPPVTNDFIALFKDTSVCSVVTLTELTKEYSVLGNNTGATVECAVAVATIYLLMSLPLSWFSRWSERRLDAIGVK